MALRDLLIAPRAPDPDAGAGRAGRRRAGHPLAAVLGGLRVGRGDRAAATAFAASLGVLAPARDVRAVGVAAGLVAAGRYPAALVCVHAAGDEASGAGLRAPARAAAARLAVSLRARGVDADARGKVVLTELDDDPAASAARALAAAGPLPTVLAVAAREPDLDVLLAAQDAVLVALPPSADPALAELAAAGARDLAPGAASISLALDPVSRALALAGLRAPGVVRSAVEGLVA